MALLPQGKTRRGDDWLGTARYGEAWLGGMGMAPLGKAISWHVWSLYGKSRLGLAMQGSDRKGEASSLRGLPWLSQGYAGPGRVRLGAIWSGKTGLGSLDARLCGACRAAVRHGRATSMLGMTGCGWQRQCKAGLTQGVVWYGSARLDGD